MPVRLVSEPGLGSMAGMRFRQLPLLGRLSLAAWLMNRAGGQGVERGHAIAPGLLGGIEGLIRLR